MLLYVSGILTVLNLFLLFQLCNYRKSLKLQNNINDSQLSINADNNKSLKILYDRLIFLEKRNVVYLEPNLQPFYLEAKFLTPIDILTSEGISTVEKVGLIGLRKNESWTKKRR